MPFEAIGNVTLILRTPGGTSDNYNLQVLPGAPSVFRSGTAGPETNLPTIVRADDGLLVTDSHPIHRKDNGYLVIYLTGLGQTIPAVGNGLPAPMSPLAVALNVPSQPGRRESSGGLLRSDAGRSGRLPDQRQGYQQRSGWFVGPAGISQASSVTSLSVRVVD